jgi:hypothetical protein
MRDDKQRHSRRFRATIWTAQLSSAQLGRAIVLRTPKPNLRACLSARALRQSVGPVCPGYPVILRDLWRCPTAWHVRWRMRHANGLGNSAAMLHANWHALRMLQTTSKQA